MHGGRLDHAAPATAAWAVACGSRNREVGDRRRHHHQVAGRLHAQSASPGGPTGCRPSPCRRADGSWSAGPRSRRSGCRSDAFSPDRGDPVVDVVGRRQIEHEVVSPAQLDHRQRAVVDGVAVLVAQLERTSVSAARPAAPPPPRSTRGPRPPNRPGPRLSIPSCSTRRGRRARGSTGDARRRASTSSTRPPGKTYIPAPNDARAVRRSMKTSTPGSPSTASLTSITVAAGLIGTVEGSKSSAMRCRPYPTAPPPGAAGRAGVPCSSFDSWTAHRTNPQMSSTIWNRTLRSSSHWRTASRRRSSTRSRTSARRRPHATRGVRVHQMHAIHDRRYLRGDFGRG